MNIKYERLNPLNQVNELNYKQKNSLVSGRYETRKSYGNYN